MADKLVVALSDLDAADLPLGGGKAVNLGRLIRAGFAVPDGFCLTTVAYRRLLEEGIAPRLKRLLANLDVEDSTRLAATGAAIRNMFGKATMPADVGAAIRAAAMTIGAHPLAVRSSATAEDLPDASFAGQMESFLNVVGERALLDAVRRCWASLWTDRAIAYRQRNQIPHSSVALAVVVQRLVAADAAGVLFTANPISSKRTEVIIEAARGLGEAVVSGLVNPDSYVVDKRTMTITAQHTNVKTVKVVATEKGGVETVALGEACAREEALERDMVLNLARLGMRIEEHFGQPQDVEWALAGGELMVLQSRPITSLYPSPPATPGELHIYFSFNAAQGIVEPLTPLGISLFQLLQAAALKRPAGQWLLVDLGGRLFADLTALLRNPLGRRIPLLMLPQIDPVAAKVISRLMLDERLAPRDGRPGAALWRLRRHWCSATRIIARLVRFLAFTSARQQEWRVS